MHRGDSVSERTIVSDTALKKTICTLGNWIYVHNDTQPKYRLYITNFVSSEAKN